MEKDPKDLEIKRLRRELRKKADQIKKLKSGEEYQNLAAKLQRNLKERQNLYDYIDDLYKEIELKDTLYYRSEDAYKRLHDKFEANFKFHEYIKDTLDQTAGLMENYNALRKQTKTVRQRVPTAEGSRGTL